MLTSGGKTVNTICRRRYRPFRLVVKILAFLAINFAFGCASRPAVVLPDHRPAYVKEIKTVRVLASQHRINTEVHLERGVLFSVMATGKIYLWRPNRSVTPLRTGAFAGWIGEQPSRVV
jgi:hypothetical protein